MMDSRLLLVEVRGIFRRWPLAGSGNGTSAAMAAGAWTRVRSKSEVKK